MDHLARLESRLARVETQNVQLRRILVAVAFVIGFSILSGQAAPRDTFETVRATRFVLVDKRGQERGVLECSLNGTELRLTSRSDSRSGSGSVRVICDRSRKGIFAYSTDENAPVTAALHISDDGAEMSLRGSQKTPQEDKPSGFSVKTDGRSGPVEMRFYHGVDDTKPSVRIEGRKDGGGVISVSEPK